MDFLPFLPLNVTSLGTSGLCSFAKPLLLYSYPGCVRLTAPTPQTISHLANHGILSPWPENGWDI